MEERLLHMEENAVRVRRCDLASGWWKVDGALLGNMLSPERKARFLKAACSPVGASP